ncbi:PGC-1 and ERR-induced regulator in muscle protein 1 [Kryptolebias marmoratus]|uniref:PPARGC1 and ESRR induced regulator, muscle 1 n=1 Tax=Kryptolebias marmoratus TaxID=37003 RepID=A0A3Q3AZW9_KRYMA|nr:PGC-1 and ERR-induced regulator in muscle protein 1 [Kryptolebias marmoratus]
MDDFEYSVEISDRDWKSFFAECEECSLLPPSLAGLDDSGMSDMDEHFLAQRMQRVASTPNFSENAPSVDSPPNCVGSPMERCFGKQGLGVDSILSGSEEDIHMQSINMFFERLKGLTEVQAGQEGVGNNKEVKQEEEHCGVGQEASGRTCPKLKALHDRDEVGAGKETNKPVNTIRNLNRKKVAEAESNLSSKPATCSNSVFSICKSAETELFVKEEPLMEIPRNEKTQWSQLHTSHEATPQSYKVEKGRSMDDINHEGLLKRQEIVSKKCSLREDHIPSQELSPSVSMKRKRRKKKRLSMEVDGDEESCERHVSAKQNDSKEELRTLKEGGARLGFSQETFNYLKEPPKNLMCFYTSNPAASSVLENLFAQDTKNEFPHSVSPSDSQNQHLPRSRDTDISSAENHSTNLRSETHLSEKDDDVTSAASSRANKATSVQACNKLQTEESTRSNPFSWLPVPLTEKGTEKSESKNKDVQTRDLYQFDRIRTSANNCENEENHSTPEVKSISLLPRGESHASRVEVGQNDKLSAAKSVLAAEAGNSGRDKCTPCQSEAEPQQQLENDCHNTNHGNTTLENTHLSASSTQQRACPFSDEISDEATCTNLKLDCINRPSICCLTENLSGEVTKQQIDCPIEAQTSNILAEKHTEVEKAQLEPSQILKLTSQSPETEVFLSEDLKPSPSDVTCVPCSCTLDTETVLSNSNENFTDMSASLCSSPTKHESVRAEQNTQILAKRDKDEATSGTTNQREPKSDFLSKAAEIVPASKTLDKPEKTENSVFAMSSFWNEMEKLTINDILGLKKLSKAAPPSPLPAVQESEETEVFPAADSGVFTPVEEPKPEQTPEKMTDSSLKSVSWESEPVPRSRGSDIYPESPALASVSDTSQTVLTETAQKCIRKIAKTVSVHNLQALESESFTSKCKKGAVQILEEQKSEQFEYLTENAAPMKDKESDFLPSSSTESYSISFTDIFQYLFGGKQSASSQSATEDKTSYYTSGNSVPETYDHFFSEFDSESFFYPLTTAEEKTKDKPVPIFSYSRSTTKSLQFPEAYEHFFASSSSDDSSVESEEEDNCSPMKVVSRFTRKASSTQLSKDMYEDFFTDRDLGEDFFSLKSLSFRKANFTAPADQNQKSNSLVPVRQSHRYTLKIGAPLNVTGDQDAMFPDPLLYHLEDRISKQLSQEPFRSDELQATVSDPRLDAPLLPLKQSDMCLVCIAFASWVLKTTNPQVGDAWKAVLLANVSALSAIRYLRKYVKVESASSERKSHQKALTDS